MKGLLFIGWMLKRMFGGVGRMYLQYDKFVVTDPGLACFPTFFASLGVSVVIILVTSIWHDVALTLYSMLFAAGVIFANYIRILLREQYKKFIKEREQIFDILKDTK